MAAPLSSAYRDSDDTDRGYARAAPLPARPTTSIISRLERYLNEQEEERQRQRAEREQQEKEQRRQARDQQLLQQVEGLIPRLVDQAIYSRLAEDPRQQAYRPNPTELARRSLAQSRVAQAERDGGYAVEAAHEPSVVDSEAQRLEDFILGRRR